MIETQVRRILERLRPSFQNDGHDIALVEITSDNVVRVSLCGHCNGGCSGSKILMGLEIQRALQAKIPAVRKVEVVPRPRCVDKTVA